MTGPADYTIDLDAEQVAVNAADESSIRLSPVHRRIVATLADRHGARSLVELIDAVWHDAVPASATASIHNHLSRLRERAPGLVVRHHDHYALGDSVVVRRPETAATVPADLADPLDQFRRRLVDDPHDERARTDLIAALAARGERREAMAEIDRARLQLQEVGLEPSRRLADLARMVADGERRADHLAEDTDERTDVGLSLTSFAVDDVADHARAWLRHDGDRILAVEGPAGSGRSHALRIVRDLGEAAGFESAELHCASFSSLPVLPVSEWTGRGPPLVLADDLDRMSDATERVLHRLLTKPDRGPLTFAFSVDDGEAESSVEQLVAGLGRDVRHWIIRLEHWDADQRTELLAALNLTADERADIGAALTELADVGLSNRACLDAIRLAAGTRDERAEFERVVATRKAVAPGPKAIDRALVASMLTMLDDDARRMIDLLSLSVNPFLFSDLADLVPDLRLQLRRREIRRLLDIDDLAGRVKTRDDVVDAVVLDGMSPRRRVELNTVLADAAYPNEAAHLRARRRAAHAAAADHSPVDAAASMSSLASAVAATGDRLTAADISQLAADAVSTVNPAQFCELSIRAGSELLTAGDPVGLRSLEAALEVAVANGLTSLAARATWAYCGLGPTSGAGQIDERAAALLSRIEPLLVDDADLALVLTAWTMVHTLTGDSEQCAASYERAEHHARASGDDGVLADTLPSCFMSLAAPEHLERREALATELHALAERTGRMATSWEASHLEFSNQLQRGEPELRETLEALRNATGQLDGAMHDWELTYLTAVIAQIDGDLDEAMRLAEQSLGVGSAVGDSRRTAVFGAILLGNHLASGTVAELYPFLEQMIADQPLLAAWRAPFALAAAELDRYDVALEHLNWLAAPEAIERDCTMSAVAMVAGDAVAAVASADLDDEFATEADRLASRFLEVLTPWSGRWSWYGAGTYGPIDITLARLHRCRRDESRAIEFAAGAAAQAARLRAPVHSRAAAHFLI